MRIAYLCPSINPIKGGIERVTYILKNHFESKGHIVYCIALKQSDNQNEDKLIFLPDSKRDNSVENKEFLQKYVVENHIDIIIVQIGAPGDGSDLVASISNNVIKIACIHLDLLDSVRHYGAYQSVLLNKRKLGFLVPFLENNLLTEILVWLKKRKYKRGYENLYNSFDRIVLLSDKFKSDFEYISGLTCKDKVIGLPNPLPCSGNDYFDQKIEKKRTLLYVGRINTGQKKVDYLLKIWSRLYTRFPNWELKIVGDGPELEDMKKLAIGLGLERYSFEGYRSPEPYYAESPILCLTSSYEGFGMVLIEAMKYGVVPVAFNSYASVSDIIDDNINGLLVKPFDIERYAQAISSLINDSCMLKQMSVAASTKARLFSCDLVGDKWLDLFNTLLLKR